MTEVESSSGSGDIPAPRVRGRKSLAEKKLEVTTDPLRLAIVSHLTRRPASAVAVAKAVGAPYEKARYLLRKMRKAGFVEVAGTALRGRVRENIYRVDPKKLQLSDVDLSELSPDRLEVAHVRILRLMYQESIRAARAGSLCERKQHGLVRFPLILDTRGWTEAAQLHEWGLREALEIRERSQERLARPGAETPIEASVAIFFFQRPEGVAIPDGVENRRRSPMPKSGSDLQQELLAGGEPVRMAVLTGLTLAPASAAELAEQCDLPVRRVRYEIGRMAEVGLVDVHEERTRRGAVEHVYFAESRRATFSGGQAEGDTQGVAALFREALDATQAGYFRSRMDSVVARIPANLDEEGMTEMAGMIADLLERMFTLREQSRERLDAGGGEGIAATSGLLLFDSVAPPTT